VSSSVHTRPGGTSEQGRGANERGQGQGTGTNERRGHKQVRGLVRTSAASPGSEDACEDERQGVHEGGDARERALRGRGRRRYAYAR
jgi:hypothetical protein